jgi:hypothetical protein
MSTQLDRLEAYFRERPGQWIDLPDLARAISKNGSGVGLAVHSRIAELRQRRGMKIENRSTYALEDGERVCRSSYRFVPGEEPKKKAGPEAGRNVSSKQEASLFAADSQSAPLAPLAERKAGPWSGCEMQRRGENSSPPNPDQTPGDLAAWRPVTLRIVGRAISMGWTWIGPESRPILLSRKGSQYEFRGSPMSMRRRELPAVAGFFPDAA